MVVLSSAGHSSSHVVACGSCASLATPSLRVSPLQCSGTKLDLQTVYVLFGGVLDPRKITCFCEYCIPICVTLRAPYAYTSNTSSCHPEAQLVHGHTRRCGGSLLPATPTLRRLHIDIEPSGSCSDEDGAAGRSHALWNTSVRQRSLPLLSTSASLSVLRYEFQLE